MTRKRKTEQSQSTDAKATKIDLNQPRPLSLHDIKSIIQIDNSISLLEIINNGQFQATIASLQGSSANTLLVYACDFDAIECAKVLLANGRCEL